MANQILKDKFNRKIGEIREVSGKLVIYDSLNSFKGTYNPKSNTTYDNLNRKVGSGNLLTTLL